MKNYYFKRKKNTKERNSCKAAKYQFMKLFLIVDEKYCSKIDQHFSHSNFYKTFKGKFEFEKEF